MLNILRISNIPQYRGKYIMLTFSPRRSSPQKHCDGSVYYQQSYKNGVSSTSDDKSRSTSLIETSTHEHKRFAPYGNRVPDQLWGIKNFRQHLYYVFHDETYSKTSMIVLIFILTLIIISTIFYVLETVPALSKTEK